MFKLARNSLQKWNFPRGCRAHGNRIPVPGPARSPVDAGATVLNLPDTVGYAVPEEYAEMFLKVREHLGDPEHIILKRALHDDLGLAVANSLAAVRRSAPD